MLYSVCPTCRMLLADKQLPYEELIKSLKGKNLSKEKFLKIQNKFFIDIGIGPKRYCCRMRIISYVDHSKIVV